MLGILREIGPILGDFCLLEFRKERSYPKSWKYLPPYERQEAS